MLLFTATADPGIESRHGEAMPLRGGTYISVMARSISTGRCRVFSLGLQEIIPHGANGYVATLEPVDEMRSALFGCCRDEKTYAFLSLGGPDGQLA